MKASLLTPTLLALSLSAGAGIFADTAGEPSHGGDWCAWLDDAPLELHRDKKNPWVQRVQLGFVSHLQYAYVDVNGLRRNFSDDIFDFRRLRLKGRIDFLEVFQLKANINFMDDTRQVGQGRDFGYNSIQSATLELDLAEAFDLDVDDLDLWVGKKKIGVTYNQSKGSQELRTLERAAIESRVRPTNSTGVGIDFSKGPWSAAVAFHSDIDDRNFDFFDRSRGEVFYAHLEYEFGNGDDLSLDYVKSSGRGDFFEIDWAGVLNFHRKEDRFDLVVSAIFGEADDRRARRDGSFYGFVFQPSYELSEKWELVGRYAFQTSKAEQGIRLNPRYVRDAADNNIGSFIDGGRGDEHHSIYLGVNHELCKGHCKLLTGVQWDRLDTRFGKVEAMTLGTALRVSF